MTRSEAEQLAARLEAGHPQRETHRFFAREAGGGRWEVARVEMPRRPRPQELTPTVDASPRPSPADDPRSGHETRVPGFPGGLG